MRASEQCIAAIRQREAFTPIAKHLAGDAPGVITGGYGDTLDVHLGQVFTLEQAEKILRAQVGHIETSLNEALRVPVTQGQFDALTDFAYNVGMGALLHSTLLKKLNAGDYAGAVREFPKWDRANGQILAGLEARRAVEAAWFRVG